MKRVIFNQKGGVGKSTITANLAAISAAKGKKTLLLDLDVQGNTTQYVLGKKITNPDETIASFFKGLLDVGFFGSGLNRPIKDVIQKTPFDNLFIIPSHPELESIQGKLESKYKIYKLREALYDLTDFDEIFIDTPPVFNFYSQSALIACDRCLIPFDCDSFSKDSLNLLTLALKELKNDHNNNLEIEGVIVNHFQQQANLPKALVNQLVSEGHPVLKTMLPSSIKVRESHSASQPLIHLCPNHKITKEFVALYEEITSKK